ncbi:ATP-binding/permease protein CydD [Lentibacillus sp. JNUCC-1]|nr:ATP-binding/permease protein CydD [Lentibacillus sp. JNUCC-1]
MKTWILPYIRFYKGRIALNVLFSVLGVGSGAMLLFISGYLISKSALRPENIMLVYVPIVAVRALSISQAVFPYLEKLTGHNVVLRILAYYRNKLYDIIEPQALMLRSRFQTGISWVSLLKTSKNSRTFIYGRFFQLYPVYLFIQQSSLFLAYLIRYLCSSHLQLWGLRFGLYRCFPISSCVVIMCLLNRNGESCISM